MNRLTFLLCVSAALQGQSLAIRAESLYTAAGPVIQDGVVLIQDGKVSAVGRAADVKVPSGLTVKRAKVAVPGLVDGRSTVGLSGLLNQSHDQDQLEGSAPLQPELRAMDAYNGRDPLVSYVRSLGVTTLHTGHGPGALISGQTFVIKTDTTEVTHGVLKPQAMVAATLGDGARAREAGKAPGTRAKQIAMLRAELVAAQEYARKQKEAEKGKEPPRDLRKEALVQVLRKELPLLATAHRAQDILSLLRLAKEFDLDIVLDGASEAYLVLDALKAAKVSVILHPTMARAFGEMENLSLETAARLQAAGIPFAFQSGFEGYVPKTRVVLWEGALATANGLSFEDTLRALTLGPARLLGIADRVGSLEKGKDGDVALFDGDPFEYTTHCVGTVINGVLVSEGEETRGATH
ncbi:amidohydrolase [Geothrix limicola]|uniref:Amidohydrolase n=1 Tax=Geothrix limicola TaxID=2927978 RepID=A0ABQ5QDC8_9BACT|nr:amidohydrolase family protein [Geothrix limicola]GLH72847.1 amidohydrolase [Geothrix limicola]